VKTYRFFIVIRTIDILIVKSYNLIIEDKQGDKRTVPCVAKNPLRSYLYLRMLLLQIRVLDCTMIQEEKGLLMN